MAFARRRACVRGRRTCTVSCTSSCSEAGEQPTQQIRCRTRLCLPAVASCRRCWWLCCSPSARCTGRVDCRPRGSPQWGAPGGTDADAARHQVGARPSDHNGSMTRRAGYPGMAVRPDESIFPKREVAFFIFHVPEAAQPRTRRIICTGMARRRTASIRALIRAIYAIISIYIFIIELEAGQRAPRRAGASASPTSGSGC